MYLTNMLKFKPPVQRKSISTHKSGNNSTLDIRNNISNPRFKSNKQSIFSPCGDCVKEFKPKRKLQVLKGYP